MNLDITEAGQFETEVKAGNQTESDIRTLALTLLIKKGEAMKMPQQGGDRSRRTLNRRRKRVNAMESMLGRTSSASASTSTSS